MSNIPLDVQRRCERRWAARFSRPTKSVAPKGSDLKRPSATCRASQSQEKPAGVTGGLAQPIPRLTADLKSSYSPAVARHDAMRNQATIASFRIVIVAAEAGGVAAPGADAARGHRGRLKQSDSRQCEHGYNCFPHRASLHCAPQEYNTFAAGLFGGRTSFAVN